MNATKSSAAMSKSGSAPITTDSRIGAAIIMLSGGRRIEAMRTHGLAESTTYANLHAVALAITLCPELDVTYDLTEAGLKERAAGFKKMSLPGLFEYAVDSIAGLAIRIAAPKKKEVKNVVRFFSGSKKTHCLNLQGVGGPDLLFSTYTCKHVGSTNDADAFENSSLKQLNEALPFPYHWVGDAAYTGTECLMIPYAGSDLHVSCPPQEWFNFWHSQIRITIERIFGIFIMRWGIFYLLGPFTI